MNTLTEAQAQAIGFLESDTGGCFGCEYHAAHHVDPANTALGIAYYSCRKHNVILPEDTEFSHSCRDYQMSGVMSEFIDTTLKLNEIEARESAQNKPAKKSFWKRLFGQRD